MAQLYAFSFNDDTLLLRASSEGMARCRAFHEVCDTYDLDPDRLEQLNWPSEGDYSRLGDLDEPVLLEGGS